MSKNKLHDAEQCASVARVGSIVSRTAPIAKVKFTPPAPLKRGAKNSKKNSGKSEKY